MNKLQYALRALACIALLGQPITIPVATAQNAPPPISPCVPQGYYFDYFNGINTTIDDAQSNLHAIARSYGRTAPSGEIVNYELFYNHSYNAFIDMIETADMRLAEHRLTSHYNLFWEMQTGDGPVHGVFKALGNAVGSASTGIDWLTSLNEEALAKSLLKLNESGVGGGNAPLQTADIAAHRTRIDQQSATGRKTIYYAHSQGNLYANLARDYISSRLEANAVRVIHVAPASPTLRGEHTLADKDLVINALRVFQGSIAPSNVDIPGWLLRPPGIDGGTDKFGHNLQAIYLNPHLATSTKIAGHVDSAFRSMSPDSRRYQPPFILKLYWEGTKDLDFDILEPGGARVQGSNYIGRSGSLDPISVTSDIAPEIYKATCSATLNQAGDFQISYVNHYAPEGTRGWLTLETPDGKSQRIDFVAGKPTRVPDLSVGTRIATLVYYQNPFDGQYLAVLRQ